MSLRFKTVVGVALIEALLLAYLILTVLGFMRDSAELALAKRAETTLALFAATAKDPLLSFDLATLDAFTSELLTIPDITYVKILAADGGTMSIAGADNNASGGFNEDYSLDQVNDGVFDTSTPISEGGIEYGSVQLGISTESIKRTIDSATSFSVTIAVIEMFLVAMFSLLLGTYLTRQLRLLRHAAKRIATGDYSSEIVIKSKDEVAEVASAFNKMSVTLRESQLLRDQYEQELRELNQTLEDRVARRTLKIEQQITEIQATNKRLSETREQLLQAEKIASIGRLAAGVSHEINNPIGFIHSNLTTLSSYIDAYRKLHRIVTSIDSTVADDNKALKQRISAHEKKHDLEFIDDDIVSLLSETINGTTRVRDIVKGLNEFSSARSTAKERCDLNQCIHKTLGTSGYSESNNIDLTTDLQTIPAVFASSADMQQIIAQLLENAADAVGDNGRIIIKSYLDTDNVFLSVSDNGAGIEPADLAKIFDPFFTTKPVGKGTGLGLAIIYGIIRDHDGEITVESKPGQGTEFIIRLPVHQQADAQLAA